MGDFVLLPNSCSVSQLNSLLAKLTLAKVDALILNEQNPGIKGLVRVKLPVYVINKPDVDKLEQMIKENRILIMRHNPTATKPTQPTMN